MIHVSNIFSSWVSRLKCLFSFCNITFFKDPVEATFKKQYYSVLEGTSKTLTCPVAGNPEPSITWYNSSGASISGEKELETGESGCYICVASNYIGTSINITECLIVRRGKFIVSRELFSVFYSIWSIWTLMIWSFFSFPFNGK